MDMASSFFWQLFEKTGSLKVYLAYKETFEKSSEGEQKILLKG